MATGFSIIEFSVIRSSINGFSPDCH